MILTLILTGVFCSIQVYMIYVYFNGFLKKRVRDLTFCLLSFFMIAGTKILPGNMPSVLKAALFLLIIGMIVFFSYTGMIIQKIYHIVFFFVIIFLSDLCLSFVANTYLPLLKYSENLIVLVYFIPNFLSILLSLAIIKGVLFLKSDVNVELKPGEYCLLGITPMMSMLGIVWLSNCKNINLLYPYFFLLVINACTMFVYYSFLKKNAKLQKYWMTETQNEYYQSCLYRQKEIIQLKHDLKNIFLELDYCIKAGESDKAADILSRLINDELYAYHNYSGCVPIDSVLSSKLYIMKQKKIEYTLDIQMPCDVEVNDIEVSAILGNMLDNAIEAVLRLADLKIRKVGIRIKYMDKKLIIHITNRSKSLKIDLAQNGLPSEKETGRVGIGIRSIKDRVNKLGGYYDFSCMDNEFQAIVVLPVLAESRKTG